MQYLDKPTFLNSARERGITEDERYAPPRCLVYVSEGDHARFWEIPPGPSGAARLALHLVRNMGSWRTCDLWFRGGRWPVRLEIVDHEEAIRVPVLVSAGARPGFEGAVRYHESEHLVLIGILAVQLMFGATVDDDLFVVPDHGHCFIQTDHHGVAHVTASDERTIEAFVARMTVAGFVLPTELPDHTFKRPRWLSDEVT